MCVAILGIVFFFWVLPVRMKFWLKMKFIETKLWNPQYAQTRSDNRCGDIEVLYQRANG